MVTKIVLVVKSFQWFFISTKDSVLFSLTNLSQQTQWNQGSRRKRHLAGLFFTGFFLSCVHVSPIKTKIGGRTNIFTGMKPLKTSYILLKREEPIKAFYTLFMWDRLAVPPRFFLSMAIKCFAFLLLLSKYGERNTPVLQKSL